MKKYLALVALLVVAVLSLSACNKSIIDTTYSFDRAILELADGSIVTGKVQTWKDYEGDQLQVKIDGVTYLVHSMDATLISE